MSNRSTTGGPKVPYYPEGMAIEAAKHLRLTVTRHLANKASCTDVVKAFEEFRRASVSPGSRHSATPHITSDGMYQGHCTCGWQSAPQPRLSAVEDTVRIHLHDANTAIGKVP